MNKLKIENVKIGTFITLPGRVPSTAKVIDIFKNKNGDTLFKLQSTVRLNDAYCTWEDICSKGADCQDIKNEFVVCRNMTAGESRGETSEIVPDLLGMVDTGLKPGPPEKLKTG